MLFNSPYFIFVFLPIVVSVFYLIGNRGHHRKAISWLVLASLYFYGYWNPAYVALMLSSILVNYSLGVSLSKAQGNIKYRNHILAAGVIFNLSLLGYFKYAHFFVNTISSIGFSEIAIEEIVLPLAISFFTFQQIA
jgi:D-alanyl-lipoteichoic acid acyltransferase DltB (MBOAT superfamily)